MNPSRKKALVTGGAGFIGSHVVDKLRAAGHEPRILDLTPSPYHADVETVLQEARHWLSRPGAVVVELAPSQADRAQAWARQLGYDEVRVESDLVGRVRALVARRSGSQ